MNILLYVRPWNKDENLEMVKKIYSDANCITISDFKNNADVWIGKWICERKEDNGKKVFNESEIDDIILRCRFLRKLKKEQAIQLVSIVSENINNLLEENNFDFLYANIPDCYTMDIIFRLCKKREIPTVSICSSFMKGYKRFTNYGEAVKCRDVVNDEEIDSVLDMLMETSYKPDFALMKEKNRKEVVKYFLRRKLIENFYFPVKKILTKDFLNYHYNTVRSDWKLKKIIPSNLDLYFVKNEEITYSNSDVYLPLHYNPEATVDYWADSPEQADYEEFIIKFIEKSSSTIRFIIKEHPSMYGKRNIDFYSKLRSKNNVALVHPYENSNLILQKIDNVLVTTGSVGVEAVLRGKRVFCTTKNYYSDFAQLKRVTYLTDNDLKSEQKTIDNRKFLYELLQCHFKSDQKYTDTETMKPYLYYSYGITELK